MYKCNICGKQYDNPSLGGPGICPACDCGYAPDGHKLEYPIDENHNPYGGKYWIKEEWGKRFSTKAEENLIEKLTVKMV